MLMSTYKTVCNVTFGTVTTNKNILYININCQFNIMYQLIILFVHFCGLYVIFII